MKETKQKEITELEARYEKLKQTLNEGWTGLIIDVKKSMSNEYFKNTAFEDKEGFIVTVKLNSDKGETFTNFFSFPDVRGIQKSNLYAFEKKYKSVPKKGIEVEVVLNEDGFFRIVI